MMVFRNDYNMEEKYYPNGFGKNRGISVGIAVSDNGIDNWQLR